MSDATMICTKKWTCGRYDFRAVLPRVGTSADKEQWIASIDKVDLPMTFGTLEDAMEEAAKRGRST